MVLVFIIIGLLIVSVIVKIVAASKKEIDLSMEVEKLGAKEGLLATHVEGLGLGPVECKIFRFDDRILIDANTHRFEIPLERVRAAVALTEEEIIQKNKSVVGRALIGTLIVPGLGTIVGGMSGIGTKNKGKKNNHYLILNFLDSNGQMAAVSFQDQVRFIMNKFCKNVNESIPANSDVIRL
ncbi:hypothetical protein [Paenibacillus sp. GCM10027626]|uniref:hypothetical protein n=1 Tax=Paenibacillus sp. GCM10027626 TaxID=3273411 RepID=UPI00363A4DBF